jgi:hypothetical protein
MHIEPPPIWREGEADFYNYLILNNILDLPRCPYEGSGRALIPGQETRELLFGRSADLQLRQVPNRGATG